MRTLLTTAACAALVAALSTGGAGAQQSDQSSSQQRSSDQQQNSGQQQGDEQTTQQGARTVSPDEYFGTQERQSSTDESGQDGAGRTSQSRSAQGRSNSNQGQNAQDQATSSGSGMSSSGTEGSEAQTLNERTLQQLRRERAERDSENAQDSRETGATSRDGQNRDSAMTDGGSDVTVTVTGLESGSGNVFVALQSNSGFAKKKGAYTRVMPAESSSVEVTFEGVEPGDYAAAAFQDTNSDGTVTLEKNGPTEPWGFSGDVSGKPSFDAAKFTVRDGEASEAEIELSCGTKGSGRGETSQTRSGQGASGGAQSSGSGGSGNQTSSRDQAASQDQDATSGSSSSDRQAMQDETSAVTVNVSGAKSGGGDLYVALQSDSSFAKKRGTYTKIVPADSSNVEVTFEDVEPGDYAVAVFQDTDGDGTVTLRRTGPTEPWGLSGDVSGKPTFDAAKFSVTSGEPAEAEVSLSGGSEQSSGSQTNSSQASDSSGNTQTRAARNASGSEQSADAMSFDEQSANTQSSQDRGSDTQRSQNAAMAGASSGSDSQTGQQSGQDSESGGDEAANATVTLTVTGLNRRGRVFAALQTEDEFAKPEGRYTKTARARNGEAEIVFDGVEPGRYAVAVFQDTDRDRSITLGENGPSEPWGFSGDVSGTPTFDSAAIEVDGETSAEISVRSGTMTGVEGGGANGAAETESQERDGSSETQERAASETSMSEEDTDTPAMTTAQSEPRTPGRDDQSAREQNTGEQNTGERTTGDMNMGPAVAPQGGDPALVSRKSVSLAATALTAQDLLGTELVNAEDSELADIRDVIIDPEGWARGVVLSSGGLFGLGADHYAVNFDRVVPERDGDTLIVRSALSDQDIQRLRAFDYDAFQDAPEGMLLATKLRGASVAIDGADDDGEVRDVVMSQDGTVDAVVLGFDGQDWALPFSDLEVGAENALSMRGGSSTIEGLSLYEGRTDRSGALGR